MAKPESPEDYVRYEAEDDLVVFLSHDLLKRQEPDARRIRFYIGGYGGYDIVLPEPANADEGGGPPNETKEETAEDSDQRQ